MSKLKRPNMAWIETAVKSVLTFGKKNATSLMTGGGIILGWAAVYVFWKESKNAEKAIQYEEKKLSEEKGEETKLSNKEKFVIYLQYCWLSAVMGLGSTALSLYSHKLDLDEIAKVYMLSQFYKDKSEGLEKQILEEKNGEKNLQKMKEKIHRENYPVEEMEKQVENAPGEGRTLFIDTLTGKKWKGDITKMNDHIAEFNEHIRMIWEKQMKRKLGDAFFTADSPYPDDLDIYAAEDLSVFLELIGEVTPKEKCRLGEIVEFRYYGGGGDLLKPSQILDYEKFRDPNTGVPVLCYIDYADFIADTDELRERYP